MKSKTRTLLLLLLMLTMQASWSQEKTQSKPIFASEYGIDLQRQYSGWEVIELMQIVAEEAEASIEKAFNEGYKQAMLLYAPEAEYWKAKAENSAAEIRRLKKQRWLFCGGGIAGGLLVGAGMGILIKLGN